MTTISAPNYTSCAARELPYRSFGLSFTYKFGKLEFKKTRNEADYLHGPPQSN